MLQPFAPIFARVVQSKQSGELPRSQERLGKSYLARPDGKLIWIHAASLGEVTQVQHVITELENAPDVRVLVTTFTAAGADWMVRRMPEILHQYAPLDFPNCVKRFLEKWEPDAWVIVENEIWPEAILQSAARQIPIVQFNARPSKSRLRIPKTSSVLLGRFSRILCHSKDVEAELLSVGVDQNKISHCADLRRFADLLPVDEKTRAKLGARIGKRAIWVAASTHVSDLNLVLDAQELVNKSSDTLLMLIPRHPNDAASILRECEQRGLTVCQRSADGEIVPSTSVYLVDSFGELGTFYSISNCVYLGGGIGDEGGHNPYEPLGFGCQILSGRRVKNYQSAFDLLSKEGDVLFLEDAPELAKLVSDFATEPTDRFELAGSANQNAKNEAVGTVVDLIRGSLS